MIGVLQINLPNSAFNNGNTIFVTLIKFLNGESETTSKDKSAGKF